MFQLKRKNVDMMKPKYKRQRAVSHEDLRSTQAPSSQQTPPNKLPFLVELNPGIVLYSITINEIKLATS